MNKIFFIVPAVAIAIIAAYALNFSDSHISKDSANWGTLGDYFGGLLNPILSFLSLIYLIKTIRLQQTANECLIRDSEHQKTLAIKADFDSKFHNLMNAQRQLLSDFEIKTQIKHNHPKLKKHPEKLKSLEAITYIENLALEWVDRNNNKELRTKIEEIDPTDSIYSLTRRFSLIICTIEEHPYEQEKKSYYDMAVKLTEYKLLCLICIYCAIFKEQAHCQSIIKSKIFDRYDLVEYYHHFSGGFD